MSMTSSKCCVKSSAKMASGKMAATHPGHPQSNQLSKKVASQSGHPGKPGNNLDNDNDNDNGGHGMDNDADDMPGGY